MATLHNQAAPERLRTYLESVLRLMSERDEINEAISDAKAALKGEGFDVAAFDKIVKERRETPETRKRRHETETIADLYRAALGMLDGTPLGDAARKRLAEIKAPEEQQTELPAPEPEKPIDREAAREEGRQAYRDTKRIIDNPYLSDDPRRAAWDEGWCLESGSDGMDIPPAWRRAKPSEDAKGEPGEGGDEGGEG